MNYDSIKLNIVKNGKKPKNNMTDFIVDNTKVMC